MDAADSPFELTEANVRRLKEKYSQEMKDDAANPIKVCMKLIFEAAIEKEPAKREQLALDLSKFLLQPSGIINLFLTVIDFDTSSQKVTTHNQRFMAIANIITCLPKLAVPFPDYCDNISKQLRSFLSSDNPKYASLSCMILKSMLGSRHARADGAIGQIILGPICSAISSPAEQSQIKLGEAIVILHNMLQNRFSPALFVELFPPLFYSALACFKTPSHLKKYLQFILKSLLNELEPGPACCLLEETIFYKRDKYFFEPMEENEAITLKAVRGSDNQSVAFDNMAEMVTKLLAECNNKPLILEFFFRFKAKLWTSSDEMVQQESASLVEPLLSETVSEGSGELDILSCMAESDNALDLISRFLLSYVECLRLGHSKLKDRRLADLSISSCLSILEVLSVSVSDSVSRRTLYNKILPALLEARSLLDQDNKTDNNNILDKLMSLVDKLKNNQTTSEQTDDNSDSSQAEYFKALNDLNDRLVPVRVHGLVTLKNLIMANNQFAVSKIPQLYDLLESSLANQESYVFLACINLMEEMSIRRTAEILPKLVNLYSNSDLDVHQRINAGEVLVRLARLLNKTTPHYVKNIMDILLAGTKHPDELMRMSSLASMGEICQQMGFSLHKYIADILTCIEEIINFDTVEVKCAAVNLLRLTLSGVDRPIVDSIQSEMKSMYKLLRKIRASTLDDKLCLQVDLALDEADRIAKQILIGQ